MNFIRDKLKNSIIQAILDYIIFASIILLITFLWIPQSFSNTLIVACMAPIAMTILSIPIFLIIVIWLALTTRVEE